MSLLEKARAGDVLLQAAESPGRPFMVNSSRALVNLVDESHGLFAAKKRGVGIIEVSCTQRRVCAADVTVGGRPAESFVLSALQANAREVIAAEKQRRLDKPEDPPAVFCVFEQPGALCLQQDWLAFTKQLAKEGLWKDGVVL